MLEIRLLGPLEVLVDGAPVELGGGRHRALLAVLALHANEVVSTDRLLESLWGETPPASAGKSLQNHVSRLRATLDAGGRDVLVTQPPGYVLMLADDAIDARRFERLVVSARDVLHTDADLASARCREGLELWRGGALAEFAYEPFAQTEIARLGELKLSAVEQRIDADLGCGLDASLVPELQGLVAEHPSREKLLGQLMLSLYRSGRQAEALAAYRVGRNALDRDLGLEPSPSLRALEQAILTQDPALESAARLPPSRQRHRRHGVIAVVSVLILAAAAAVGGWTLTRDDSAPPVVVPNSVVKIDVRSSEVVDVIPVGREPGQIEVVGPYIFATSEEDGTLHRIDIRSGEVATSGALAASGPLAGAGDSLWVTSDSRGEVVKIRMSSFLPVTRIPLEAELVHAFVAVGGGSLWISQYPSPGVLRWRLRTQRLERRYDVSLAEFPVEVTYAAEAAWVGVGSDLLRIDGRTGVSRRVPVGPGVSDPAYGFGSIWSGSVYENAVWRVDVQSERTTAIVPVGQVSFGLAVGAGSVWVTNHCDGTVSRIDPDTNSVVATVETGYYPRWLAFGHGFLWVGVSGVPNGGPIVCDEARPAR